MNDSFNPYAPPKAHVESRAEDPHEIEPVGKGKRFATYLVDYLIINFLMFVIGGVAGLMFGGAAVEFLQGGTNIVLALLVFLGYYLVFEGLWARTPAKFALGTVVVMEDGSKPPFIAILKRTLCRFIPFEPFSFFGERGWHDSISKTVVVSAR